MCGIILGSVYLVISVFAFRRARRAAAEQAARRDTEGEAVIGGAHDVMLIEGEMTADRMHKLSAICASSGRRVFDQELDYSPESVSRLDRIIMVGWGAMNGQALPQAGDPPQIAFGAYLGETLVRNTRGRWVSSLSDDPADPANVFYVTPDGNTLNVSPFLLVRSKFQNLNGMDLNAAYTALLQKLKETGVR